MKVFRLEECRVVFSGFSGEGIRRRESDVGDIFLGLKLVVFRG